MIERPTGGKLDARSLGEVRPARHGATATGPKIAALRYSRCPSCLRGVIFSAASRRRPRCPHCDSALP